MNKKILITGGCGFIGSHTCVSLIENSYDIVIIDNLYNSKKNVIDRIQQITNHKVIFYHLDLINVEQVFKEHKFDAVIHFAGLKAVGESIKKPLLYYNINIGITIKLLEMMQKYECNNLIFSSSATVYGNQIPPFNETMNTGIDITNPYGKIKFMIEEMLKDIQIGNPKMNITCLRYFNPVGSHKSGLIGEDPNDIPNNLMPIILKVANKDMSILKIFGNDYNTKDCTCLRDYIHIDDLVKGHIKALNHLEGFKVYNLGTGNGISVLEIVNIFMKVNNIKIPYIFVERREGDLESVYCDPSLALKELNWKAEKGVEEMCRDSWRFIENYK